MTSEEETFDPFSDTSVSIGNIKPEGVQDENQNQANTAKNHNQDQPTERGCDREELTSGIQSESTAESKDEERMHRCLVCRNVSKSHSSQKSHVCSHIFNVPLYQCKSCKVRFTDKQRLLKHSDGVYEEGKGYAYKSSYVCTLCGRRFAKKSTCADHIIHHDNMTHSCNQCGWLFDTSYRVHVHRALWHSGKRCKQTRENVEETVSNMVSDENRRYRCWFNGCTDFLNDYEALSVHMEKVHGTVYKPCRLCTRLFHNQSALEDHLNHHDEMIYVCPIYYCGALFENFLNFRNHYRTRHGLSDLKTSDSDMYLIRRDGTKYAISTHNCEICSRMLRNAKELKYHLKNHDKMIYVCQETNCREAFEKFQFLGRHSLAKHNKKLENPLTCKTCNRTFPGKQELENHVKNHDKMTYVCQRDDCGWAFEKYTSLISHSYNKHGIKDNLEEDKSLQEGNKYLKSCNICNRAFATNKGELENHMRNHDAMTFVCQHNGCGWAFEKAGSLRMHSARKHNIKLENETCCKMCNRIFPVEGQLENHVRNHDKMTHVCQQDNCGWAFEKYKNLRCHSANKHGIKLGNLEEDKNPQEGSKYLKICDVCNRAFHSNQELENHKRNHDAMTYVCQQVYCGWTFETYNSLRSHSYNKHGIKIDSMGENKNLHEVNKHLKICNTCSRAFYSNQELENHVRDHDKMTYVCQQIACGWAFEKNNHLATHSFRKHGIKLDETQNLPDEMKDLKICKTCNRSFPNEEQRDFHEVNHDRMTYVCQEDDCGWAFEKPQHLGSHSLHKHGIKFSSRKSDLCSRNFNSETALEYHLKYHDRMIFACQYDNCGCKFEKFNQLQAHYYDHHHTSISLLDADKYRTTEPMDTENVTKQMG